MKNKKKFIVDLSSWVKISPKMKRGSNNLIPGSLHANLTLLKTGKYYIYLKITKQLMELLKCSPKHTIDFLYDPLKPTQFAAILRENNRGFTVGKIHPNQQYYQLRFPFENSQKLQPIKFRSINYQISSEGFLMFDITDEKDQ